MIKQAITLVLIPLVLAGCNPKKNVDVQELSSLIIPYEPMSEKIMDAAEYPKGSRDGIQKHAEIFMQANCEMLSDILSCEFTPEELQRLNEIYSSELVVRLNQIRVSDEFMIGSMELAKPRIKEIGQNQSIEAIVTTPVD